MQQSLSLPGVARLCCKKIEHIFECGKLRNSEQLMSKMQSAEPDPGSNAEVGSVFDMKGAYINPLQRAVRAFIVVADK